MYDTADIRKGLKIELDGAHAWMVGGEGRGVPTILEMANHTRLDCVLSSAGMMQVQWNLLRSCTNARTLP